MVKNTDIIASALLLADGNYVPAVLVKQSDTDYIAYVYQYSRHSYTKMTAKRTARNVIAVGTKGYTNGNWKHYTNAPATLEWFKGEDFVL